MFGVNFWHSVCLNTHARLYEQSYPRAAKVILKSTYMDDSMALVLTDDEAVGLYKEMFELWGKTGMKIHKWLSNSIKVLETIPPQNRASQMNLGTGEYKSSTVKTLGVLWDATTDAFTFKSQYIVEEFIPTKRMFLKRIATLFYLLGFLSPFVVRAKILIQEG